MSPDLVAEKTQWDEQLQLVLLGLKDDPENAELIALRNEVQGELKRINEALSKHEAKKQAVTAAAAAKSPSPAKPDEKWSRENHPALKAKQPPTAKEEPSLAAVSYSVNDNVMAKWVSGDKGFYPARITAVTGSTSAPVYTVKFRTYDTVETLRGKDIRPMAQKRKAGEDDQPTATASESIRYPQQQGNGAVLSAAPSMYPQAQQGAKDGEEVPTKKFKKVGATKALEKGKNKWQEFNAKAKGKGTKKDSMFRTPEGIHGRVGFTGSGQAMRKDPTRTRHIYQQNEDLD